jgi:hypothetical protein
MERSIKIFLSALSENEGEERPTGGLVDAPSSKAVEEAGHCGKIVRFGVAGWQKRTFDTQRKGGREKMKIAKNPN